MKLILKLLVGLAIAFLLVKLFVVALPILVIVGIICLIAAANYKD